MVRRSHAKRGNDQRCQDYIERVRLYLEFRRCCGISGETDMLVYVEAASYARETLDELSAEEVFERRLGQEQLAGEEA